MRKSFMSKEIERWEGKPSARKEEGGKECEENESGKKNHGRGEAFLFSLFLGFFSFYYIPLLHIFLLNDIG